jgi:hypothetical protein
LTPRKTGEGVDTASQYDLADLIGEHRDIITEAYRRGLPSGFDADTGPRIPRLGEIGILDSRWHKLATSFEAVMLDVAAGRDVEKLEAADFLRIAARHSEWYFSTTD